MSCALWNTQQHPWPLHRRWQQHHPSPPDLVKCPLGPKPLPLHTFPLSNSIPLVRFNSSLHRDGSYTWIFLSRPPASQFLLMYVSAWIFFSYLNHEGPNWVLSHLLTVSTAAFTECPDSRYYHKHSTCVTSIVTIPSGNNYYSINFINEETEVQMGWKTCPNSYTELVAELECAPTQPDYTSFLLTTIFFFHVFPSDLDLLPAFPTTTV